MKHADGDGLIQADASSRRLRSLVLLPDPTTRRHGRSDQGASSVPVKLNVEIQQPEISLELLSAGRAWLLEG